MAGVWQDLAGSEARQTGGEGLVTDEREELAVRQAGSVRGRFSLLRQSFMVCASHALELSIV
jgi:hypothetical protein